MFVCSLLPNNQEYLVLKEALKTSGKNIKYLVYDIYRTFIDNDAPNELNINASIMHPCRCKKEIALASNDQQTILAIFDPIYIHIGHLIETNCISQFSREVSKLKTKLDE